MITDSPEEKVTFQKKIKRFYQRSLLWVIGQIAPVKIKRNPVSSPKNILVFVQEKLGDAILITPLFNNLKSQFHNIQIHVVIFHKQSNIFNNDPNIYKVHNFKNDKIGTTRSLKKLKFDIIFNTKDHPSFTFIILGRFLNARYKVSLDHQFHRNHYNHLLQVDSMAHIIEKNCSLFSIWNIPFPKLKFKPYMPPRPITNEVAYFVEKMPKQTLIGINLSAGSTEREWQLDKWKALIRQLDEKFIVFAIGNRLMDKELLESEFRQIEKSPETKTINDAAALVQRLKLLITPNTGLLHVASCCNINVVGLYHNDPLDHMRFAPFSVHHKKLIAGDHILDKIPVAQVVGATQDLLNDK